MADHVDRIGQAVTEETAIRCARAGCRKTVPRVAILAGDAFCSTDCCRRHFGVDIDGPPPENSRRARGQVYVDPDDPPDEDPSDEG